MILEKRIKIYRYKVNEKGIIEKNEIDARATKGIVFVKETSVYKKDLGKWRVSYMYSFDPDLDKAAQSLMESLKGKIEKNRNIIELKMQANAEYERLLEKLAIDYKGGSHEY